MKAHPLELLVQERLTEALAPTILQIVNESEQHAGHAGAQGGAQHLYVRIVSAQFLGINMVQRHRLIYNALFDLMPNQLHALRIDAQID